MCGRYVVNSYFGDLWTRFDLKREEIDYAPRFNVAPTQLVLAVLDDGSEDGPHGEMLRWGLIPSYTKDLKKSPLMINARAETVAASGAFRHSFRQKRCLIVATGFYEWRKEGKERIPMYISLESGEPFAFAGLWSDWTSSEGDEIRSCTIITTDANEIMQPIHNRMPVILPREMERRWLEEPNQDLLVPHAGGMIAYEVSAEVNNFRNESPQLIKPI